MRFGKIYTVLIATALTSPVYGEHSIPYDEVKVSALGVGEKLKAKYPHRCKPPKLPLVTSVKQMKLLA